VSRNEIDREFMGPDASTEWRRGWTVVLGVAIAAGTGGGLFFYISSLFIEGLTQEFGWSRGEIAGVFGIAGLGALLSPVIGWLADRYGFRRVAFFCSLGLISLFTAFAFYRGPLIGFLALSACYGFVAVGTAALIYTRPINGWFDKSRGLALGVSTLGVSIFAIVTPPLMHAVMAEHGWRAGYLVLAVLAGGLGLPAMLLLVRNPPREVAGSDAPPAPLEGMTPTAAIRTAPFWLMALALAAINGAGTGLLSQLAPLLQDKGLSSASAAQALSMYAAGLIVGRLGCGALIDRLPAARVAAAFTLLPALGCAVLFGGGFGALPALAFGAALLIGVQQGAETDVLAWFVARLFGLRCYGAIFGAVLSVGYTGTIVGIVMFGVTHDLTGAYDLALIGAAAAFLLGATAFLFIGPAPPRTAPAG
jgi:nitrate/nitrite transporter NarK